MADGHAASLAFDNFKAEEFRQENALLGAAITDLQAKLSLAERRVRDAEARSGSSRVPGAKTCEQLKESQLKLEKLKRRSVNDRVLLEQALRGKQALEQQLAEESASKLALMGEMEQLRHENAVLLRQRDQAAAAAARSAADSQLVERQLQQLESLQGRNPANQQREAELQEALVAEGHKVRELERRCAELCSQLELAQANLHAAQLSRESQSAAFRQNQEQRNQLPHGLQQQHQQKEGNWSQPPGRGALTALQQLADLDDLNEVSHFQCGSSPARPGSDGVGDASPVAARRGLPCCGDKGATHAPSERGDDADRHDEAEGGSIVGGCHHPHEQQQPPWGVAGNSGAGPAAVALQRQVDKLQRRNTQLQVALADTHLRHSQALVGVQQQLKALEVDVQRLQGERASALRQVEVLRCAGTAAQLNEEALAQTVERLHEEVINYALRMNSALKLSADLMQEKGRWTDQLQAVERHLEACRAELHAARLQQAQRLAPAASASVAAEALKMAPFAESPAAGQALVPVDPCPSSSAAAAAADAQHEQLVQHLVEAQAQEAALRGVLEEVRREQVATCRAVSNELRRVHALEKMRMADMREGQRLQRRVAELQAEVLRLHTELTEERLRHP